MTPPPFGKILNGSRFFLQMASLSWPGLTSRRVLDLGAQFIHSDEGLCGVLERQGLVSCEALDRLLVDAGQVVELPGTHCVESLHVGGHSFQDTQAGVPPKVCLHGLVPVEGPQEVLAGGRR